MRSVRRAPEAAQTKRLALAPLAPSLLETMASRHSLFGRAGDHRVAAGLAQQGRCRRSRAARLTPGKSGVTRRVLANAAKPARQVETQGRRSNAGLMACSPSWWGAGTRRPSMAAGATRRAGSLLITHPDSPLFQTSFRLSFLRAVSSCADDVGCCGAGIGGYGAGFVDQPRGRLRLYIRHGNQHDARQYTKNKY